MNSNPETSSRALIPLTNSDLRPVLCPNSHLILLWLSGRPKRTYQTYLSEILRFNNFMSNVSFREITLFDLQQYQSHLINTFHLSASSICLATAILKSFFKFCYQNDCLLSNPARALRNPKRSNDLSQKLLTSEQIQTLIQSEPNLRNQLLFKVLYYSGARVSEIVNLTWKNVQPREKGGQLTLHGKGGKTRSVLLPVKIWEELQQLRHNRLRTDPVFPSRKDGGKQPLDSTQVFRLLRKAAQRIGLPVNISPHWLRHSHATHALKGGAPLPVLQATLGHASIATTGKYLHAQPTDSSSCYL